MGTWSGFNKSMWNCSLCYSCSQASVLNLIERCVDIEFPEGLLNIEWKKNNNIYMTGKVSEIKKIEVNILL